MSFIGSGLRAAFRVGDADVSKEAAGAAMKRRSDDAEAAAEARLREKTPDASADQVKQARAEAAAKNVKPGFTDHVGANIDAELGRLQEDTTKNKNRIARLLEAKELHKNAIKEGGTLGLAGAMKIVAKTDRNVLATAGATTVVLTGAAMATSKPAEKTAGNAAARQAAAGVSGSAAALGGSAPAIGGTAPAA